jgi:hypothetical protein
MPALHLTEPSAGARGAGSVSRRRPRTRRLAAMGLAAPSGPPIYRALVNVVLAIGGGALAAAGMIHLYLWADGYRNVTTIGPLFLVNGIVGLVLAVLVWAQPRVVVALVGGAFLAISVGALLQSVWGSLLGFQDSFDAPWAVTSLVVESAGALVLLGGALLSLRDGRSSSREAPLEPRRAGAS